MVQPHKPPFLGVWRSSGRRARLRAVLSPVRPRVRPPCRNSPIGRGDGLKPRSSVRSSRTSGILLAGTWRNWQTRQAQTLLVSSSTLEVPIAGLWCKLVDTTVLETVRCWFESSQPHFLWWRNAKSRAACLWSKRKRVQVPSATPICYGRQAVSPTV